MVRDGARTGMVRYDSRGDRRDPFSSSAPGRGRSARERTRCRVDSARTPGLMSPTGWRCGAATYAWRLLPQV